jgi:hypothetical protein
MNELKQEDEFKQVTIKVPIVIMKLILDQNYFGYTPEKFFADCIRFGVTCYFDYLPNEEQKRLERIYKVKAEFRVQL